MYGLNVSLGGHVHRPERHGSKLEISGTKHSLPVLCGVGRQKPFAQKGNLKPLSLFIERDRLW